MIELPKQRDANTQAAKWLNQLLAFVRANRVLGGRGILVQETPNGKMISVIAQNRGAGSGSAVGMFKLKSAQSDYLTCRTWDGENEGGTDIYIAKPHKVRCSLTTEVVMGEIHSYTYGTGLDSSNPTRLNTIEPSGPAEYERVLPPWSFDEVIYAITATTGVTYGSPPVECGWLLINRTAAWGRLHGT